MKGRLVVATLLVVLLVRPAPACPPEDVVFELITGHVLSSPKDLIETKAGILRLGECVDKCRRSAKCKAVNFETGLCLLMAANLEDAPDALTPSQFPVFTLFAQKTCVAGAGKACLLGRRRRPWAVELVPGYRLNHETPRRRRQATTRQQCEQHCLGEKTFICRSANYNYETGVCELSDMDRFTAWGHRMLVPWSDDPRKPKMAADGQAPKNVYIESNCVTEPVRMCDFQQMAGKILKTVDAVRQDVSSLEDCRKLCLDANFRCHTFDYGDTGDKVCRLSHHSMASLVHIEAPYLDVEEAMTYQVTSCYNVTIDCRATDMVARIQTNRIFNGKVYVKARPNSCVLNVTNSLEFELNLGYHDLNCDVQQEAPGKFSANIIIQHHDQIVTSEDVGLSVKCSYNLQNRSVSNGMQLQMAEYPANAASESSFVLSPTVSMRITDRRGQDIHTAQVGDPLSLRFEILDGDTPYDIFVRELVALDGVDGSEILLVDSLGCPTDPTIMGALTSESGGGGKRVLQAPFDAFKFPTSDVVQFKALVTPCLPQCEPTVCNIEDYYGLVRQTNSYGRRRRSVDEEMLVVQSIRIADKFQFGNETGGAGTEGPSARFSPCFASPALLFTVFLFVFAQLLIVAVWAALLWRRRRGADQGRLPTLPPHHPAHPFFRLYQ
ncbi:uncharacterized protein LOC124171342 [Ischnura elegans]|uniref:uncharacterized protein LOC124171342 n=1 Tax=Ischnura elegans TaxID=197161 RepID=UPI001ED895DC|nr:uncharacterized protein LOC124171342 [Ischnura elegans]